MGQFDIPSISTAERTERVDYAPYSDAGEDAFSTKLPSKKADEAKKSSSNVWRSCVSVICSKNAAFLCITITGIGISAIGLLVFALGFFQIFNIPLIAGYVTAGAGGVIVVGGVFAWGLNCFLPPKIPEGNEVPDVVPNILNS